MVAVVAEELQGDRMAEEHREDQVKEDLLHSKLAVGEVTVMVVMAAVGVVMSERGGRLNQLNKSNK